ncbi:hypothetical protein [Bordetella trematum]|uniref:hypothetical protein n=1 Tax=Bordetella trematum TaxID=123899 RepID=UPI0007C7D0B4|nr:hypothetical protein [Bordetella trematum]
MNIHCGTTLDHRRIILLAQAQSHDNRGKRPRPYRCGPPALLSIALLGPAPDLSRPIASGGFFVLRALPGFRYLCIESKTQLLTSEAARVWHAARRIGVQRSFALDLAAVSPELTIIDMEKMEKHMETS